MTSTPPPPPPLQGKPAAALLGVAALGAAALFVAIVVASLRKSPNLSGLLTGVFTGLFVALLALAAAAWGVVRLVSPPKPLPPPDPVELGELHAVVAPVMAELESVRRDYQARIRARSITRIPLCLLGALVLWGLMQFGRKPTGLFELGEFALVAGVGGGIWAGSRLAAEYARLYKSRVLPLLAARFGALSYRRSPGLDLGRFAALGLFGKFDSAAAEDEIFGTYQGHPVRVVELTLDVGSGDNRRVVFDGLVIEIVLPRRLLATTAVVVNEADPDPMARLRGLLLPGDPGVGGLRPVGLEDPVFSGRYRVYGDDQVEARALLTPTFMERFLALSALTGFARPVALAEGARLTIALPKASSRNLFEPSPYSRPADSGRALIALSQDIAASLRMVDAVIALDD